MNKSITTKHPIAATAATAEAVWQLLRDGSGVDAWLPIVTACRIDGDKRVCEVEGGQLDETILRSDDATRTFVYRIDAQPLFPATDITGTMRVEPAGPNACTLHWGVDLTLLDPEAWEQVRAGTEQLYAAGAQQLERLARDGAVAA